MNELHSVAARHRTEPTISERLDDLTITLTMDEAITALAALELAGDDVTRATAESVAAKIDTAIEDA